MKAEKKEYILKDDEYINPADGLIWCRKCNTPRQTRKSYGFYSLSPMIPCSCLLEERKREEEYRKAEEARRYSNTLREKGLGWNALEGYRFENDTLGDPIIMDYMKKLAGRYNEITDSGFLLWGPHGTGKTFAAACVINDLIDRGSLQPWNPFQIWQIR